METIKNKQLTILLKRGYITFEGKYRRDLERPNWHYYETINGDIYHFRKDQMVGVLENSNYTAKGERLINEYESIS